MYKRKPLLISLIIAFLLIGCILAYFGLNVGFADAKSAAMAQNSFSLNATDIADTAGTTSVVADNGAVMPTITAPQAYSSEFGGYYGAVQYSYTYYPQSEYTHRVAISAINRVGAWYGCVFKTASAINYAEYNDARLTGSELKLESVSGGTYTYVIQRTVSVRDYYFGGAQTYNFFDISYNGSIQILYVISDMSNTAYTGTPSNYANQGSSNGEFQNQYLTRFNVSSSEKVAGIRWNIVFTVPSGCTVTICEMNDKKIANAVYENTMNGTDYYKLVYTTASEDFEGWKASYYFFDLHGTTAYPNVVSVAKQDSTLYYNADGTGARTCNLSSGGTLYAWWNVLDTYAVTLDQSEATASGTVDVTATYNRVLPAISVPTRTGFSFDGYFSDENGGGTRYYSANGIGTNVWGQNSGATLYAYWTINAISATPSSNITKTYDGAESTLTCSSTHALSIQYQWYKGGSAIQDAITDSYTVKNVADSGSYTCAVSVSSDGQSSTATTSPITVAISRRAVTVNANAINKTYGEALTDTFTYQATNVVDGEALTGTLSCTPIQAYGTYPITQGSLTNENNANYNITFNGADYTIAKYALTVTATAVNKTYGEDLLTSFDYTITEGTLQNNDTALVGALACSTLTQAYGTYPITRGTLTNENNANYNITFNGANYSIAKYALTVMATAVNKTYGEDLLTSFAYTITEGTLQNNDTALVGSLACPTLTQAFGTYEITQGTLTNDNNANYNITFNGADYSIAKYALTVTATAINKTYGEELLTTFAYTITAGELQNNDIALNGALACPILTQAYGDYPITQGTVTNNNNANYNITFIGADYSIAKYALTVTATAINKIYGENLLTSFGYTITKGTLQNNDTALVGTLECTPVQAYGTYPITQGTLTNANNANYNITFEGANYSVAKYALTVTATAVNKTYGEELLSTFAYTITEGELQNNDTALVGALACPTLTQAYGDYEITQGTLSNDNNSNYDIRYISADYSIAKYALTVTATPISKTYGEDLLTSFDYTITKGTLQNNDTALVGVLECTPIQAYGTYPITQGTLTNDNNANYNITFEGADYSIAKYALTVTATAINKTYGEELLTVFGYTITVGELQNSDTALVGALECTPVQAFGTYPITQGTLTNESNVNYTITFNGADYSIAKKDITGATVTLGDSLTYNGTEQTQTVESVVIDELPVTYDLSDNKGTNATEDTSYTLTIKANGNFTGTVTKDFSIAKKDITGATVTLGDSLTYNGAEQTQTVESVVIDELAVTYDLSDNKATDATADTAYTLTIKANGNFTGTITKDFSIAKKDITGATVTLGAALTYNGEEQTQTVTSVVIDELTVTYDLTDNKATTATIDTNYTLTITANGNFTGVVTKEFSIARAEYDMSLVEYNGVQLTYTGSSRYPTVDESWTIVKQMDTLL